MRVAMPLLIIAGSCAISHTDDDHLARYIAAQPQDPAQRQLSRGRAGSTVLASMSPSLSPSPDLESWCANGIWDGVSATCCEASCGVCGGTDCDKLPGGTDRCCTGGIVAGGAVCASKHHTACILPEEAFSSVEARDAAAEEAARALDTREMLERAAAQSAEALKLHTRAQRFVYKMGNGININPNVMADVGALDWPWLAHQNSSGELPIAHVRLNGNIAEPLQDWTTCPATTNTLQRLGGSEEGARFRISQGLGQDPISTHFTALKTAAVRALREGLQVVISPLHRRHRVDVNGETLRWVWGAMLEAFPTEDFPVDRVAFQMVHDPTVIDEEAAADGLYYGGVKREDAPQWEGLVANWSKQVQQAQPGRVLFVSALRANASASAYEATRDFLVPGLRERLGMEARGHH